MNSAEAMLPYLSEHNGNTSSLSAMAAAIKDTCDHPEENARAGGVVPDRLIRGLVTIPHSAHNGDRTRRLTDNEALSYINNDSSALLFTKRRGRCYNLIILLR